MKTNKIYLLLSILFFAVTGISAQVAENKTILISGTKFTYPLVEKWIAEYAKVNPTSTIQLATKYKTTGQTDLNIIAHQPAKGELKENQEILYTGRYGLLPVTNTNNPILSSAKRGLTKRDIDKLFFEVENIDEDPVIEKPKFPATIYARDNKACASTALANYFGHVSSEIRGKKILGDDIYLISAIKRDTIGLTYNNLGYLYDTNSRKLKDGIALLPLDLKKDVKALTVGNLDEVISILEKNKIETIPVEKIGFIYTSQDVRKEVSDFLKWVLTDGQKFNHSEGFLNLEKQDLAEQTNLLNEKLLSLK
jgi:phosphate transport system substrate-binding protein